MDDRRPASLEALLSDLVRFETEFESWDEAARATVSAYRGAIDALTAEALRRLIGRLKDDPAARAGLKEAAADDIVYAVLRHHGLVKPSLTERVEAALDKVRPALAAHNGNVELVRLTPPGIEVRFTGACDSCPASALTFRELVQKVVQEACPEITDVTQARGPA